MRRSLARSLARALQQQSQASPPCPPLRAAAPAAAPRLAAAHSPQQPFLAWLHGACGPQQQQQPGEPKPEADAVGEQGPAAEAKPVEELSAEELRAELQRAQNELQEAQKQVADLKDRWLRAHADVENMRDRTARQAAEAKQFAVQGLVKQLLDVADNLERAAAAVPEDVVASDGDAAAAAEPGRVLGLLRSLREGVLMTDGILMKVLEREGVKRYDPLGEPFDPNLHNALLQVPDPSHPPSTVALVLKKGYLLHERAVRAAEVGVTPAGPPAE